MMLHFVFRNSHWFVLYIEHWLTLTLDMQWRHHSLTVFLSLHASLAQNRTKAKINGKTQIQAYCHQTAPESSVMISTNNVEYENSQFFFLIWFLLNIFVGVCKLIRFALMWRQAQYQWTIHDDGVYGNEKIVIFMHG